MVKDSLTGGYSDPQKHQPSFINKSVIESIISGSASSAITTIIYQPLELIKTQIQIRNKQSQPQSDRIFGRLTKSVIILSREHGVQYLWRGTSPVSIEVIMSEEIM